MAMEEPHAPSGSEVQVTVTFITKLPASLRVPPSPVTVPGNLTRYGLSQIINHLLALDPPRPFDFLIQDELLRLSLHQHMDAKQLTTEAVLEVEYVPAVLPPTPKEEHPHDDWISSLAVLPNIGVKSKKKAGEGPLIAAGCYDGVVRLWQDGSTISTFAAHKGALKAAAVVSAETGGSTRLVTGGDDAIGRVWSWSQGATGASTPELMAVLKGHKASIEAVAVNPDGDRCVTAGWDGQIFLFNAGAALEASIAEAATEAEEGNQKKKKRKAGVDGSVSVPIGGHEEHALSALGGSGGGQRHSQCVSSLAWPSETTLVSGCWDHSVRVWDPEVSAVLDTFTHNKAVHCVATPSSGDASVIAFGGADKTLRVWDRRTQNKGDAIAVRGLTSHTDWIAALAWHPTSEHHLMSASYDKTAKLWDVRASVPLHTLPAAAEKLLSCAWVAEGEVAYGGADCVLRTATIDLGL